MLFAADPASTPASLSQNEGVWVVDAAVPEGTTACFLNVKTGPLTASSDYFQNK